MKAFDADLKITVGADNGEAKTFWHYSVVMASYSNYIDTMLASSMIESESRAISFPDIESKLWLKLVNSLGVPGSKMTAQDALLLTEFCDKYEFQSGLELCSRTMVDYLKNNWLSNRDLTVNIIVTSNKFNLKEAYEAGLEYIERMLNCRNLNLRFNEEQIGRLAPIISQAATSAIGQFRYWQRDK